MSASVTNEQSRHIELGGQRERLLEALFGDLPGPQWARSRLLRPGEVATIFQVSRRTINEWARMDKLPFLVTLGGQKRFPADRVRVLLIEMETDAKHARPARRRSRSVARPEEDR